jgi:hypothetical protein
MPNNHYYLDSLQSGNLELEEEAWGNIRLFPKTSQLPELQREMDRQFRAPLSQLISRVSARSDDFWKIARKAAAFAFCHYINSGRSDKLRLFCLPDHNKVARITIVQQMTRHEEKGAIHSFRFYGGEDFFPEIRLSGRRLLFTNHILERFKQRADNLLVEEIGAFLNIFFNSCVIGMEVNGGQALILPNHTEFLAFTYRKDPSEYVLTTCLAKEQVNNLKPTLPAKVFNLHYGESFSPPHTRNWNPLADMLKFEAEWKSKEEVDEVEFSYQKDWPTVCNNFHHSLRQSGFNGHSTMHFVDDIPGPHTLALKPEDKILKFDAEYLAHDFFNETCLLLNRNSQFLPDRFWHTRREDIADIYDKIIESGN